MRPTTAWGIGMGLLSLCTLVTLLQSLGAEATSPERLVVAALCQALPARCPLGAGQTTAADLRILAELLLQPAATAPPEDPLAIDCQHLGFQTEWVASKRDAGLPLGEVWLASQRVFARDLPWQDALAGALGTLVYRAPQRSPEELRQAMEAACLAQHCTGRSAARPSRRGARWRGVGIGGKEEDHATESLDTTLLEWVLLGLFVMGLGWLLADSMLRGA